MNWQPLPSDYITVNVDANFVESISAASVGMMLRDAYGKVIISSWDFIGHCKSVEEAEFLVCLACLCIGITPHNPIILEIGCVFVAAALANGKFDRSSLVDLKK